MFLEEKIGALIAALEQNTNAIMGKVVSVEENPVPDDKSESSRADSKPETAKQKKNKTKSKTTKTNSGKVTVASVKACAKKIAIASENPQECMLQIAELRNVTAESCYEDANVGLDKFDATGLILFQEELDKFVYLPPIAEEEVADELEI